MAIQTFIPAPSLAIDLNIYYGIQRIAYFDRPCPDVPVLFVHGLGNAAANFDGMLVASKNSSSLFLDCPPNKCLNGGVHSVLL